MTCIYSSPFAFSCTFLHEPLMWVLQFAYTVSGDFHPLALSIHHETTRLGNQRWCNKTSPAQWKWSKRRRCAISESRLGCDGAKRASSNYCWWLQFGRWERELQQSPSSSPTSHLSRSSSASFSLAHFELNHCHSSTLLASLAVRTTRRSNADSTPEEDAVVVSISAEAHVNLSGPGSVRYFFIHEETVF